MKHFYEMKRTPQPNWEYDIRKKFGSVINIKFTGCSLINTI